MPDTDLDRMQELYDFLQGTVPEGYQIPEADVPHLSADQAWTVCWYLGNQYWQVSDCIERCEGCGTLYDSRSEGTYAEDGPPHNLCDECSSTREKGGV
jgi:hypothetical protein